MLRYLWLLLFGFILIIIVGCTSSKPLVSSAKIKYSLIYIIHADANYLYHDNEGDSHQANLDELKEAMRIGRNAINGEVFIFHQEAEHKVLWIFPKKDRLFLHYRNGRLLQNEHYSPHSKIKSFVTEAELYKKNRLITPSEKKIKHVFLYFGHEIPYRQTISYHHSRPDAVFNINTFVNGLQSFMTKNQPFDLAVLSTCNNGTPEMVSRLQPFTHYLLASSENLHLSNIDTDSLLLLNQEPDISTLNLAKKIAAQTFNRLSKSIQTVITLSVYDMDKTDNYIRNFSGAYHTYRENHGPSDLNKDNIDCAQFSFFNSSKFKKGVLSYYRPPSFGSKHSRFSFSGWGCRE